MNILINTPLLNKSASIREDFDNKVLIILLLIIGAIIISGLLFIDFTKSLTIPDSNNPEPDITIQRTIEV